MSRKRILIALLFACVGVGILSCQKLDVDPDINTAPASDIISPVTTPDPAIDNIPNPAVIQVRAYVSIEGDWMLISDSTSTTMAATDHLTATGYLGRPGDHFDFTNGGKLYISEDSKKDTASYAVTRGNKIVLNYPNEPDTAKPYTASLNVFNPVKLTPKNITLVSSIVSPLGATYRTIQLKR